VVSKPHQLYISASIGRPSSRRPCFASSRARLIVARNSHDFALRFCAIFDRLLKETARFPGVGLVLPKQQLPFKPMHLSRIDKVVVFSWRITTVTARLLRIEFRHQRGRTLEVGE
jgi:hypothetical protein